MTGDRHGATPISSKEKRPGVERGEQAASGRERQLEMEAGKMVHGASVAKERNAWDDESNNGPKIDDR